MFGLQFGVPPEVFRIVLAMLWVALHSFSVLSADEKKYVVSSPPPELKIPEYYSKFVSASGYPIVASKSVDDRALLEAAFLVDLMLAKRSDV